MKWILRNGNFCVANKYQSKLFGCLNWIDAFLILVHFLFYISFLLYVGAHDERLPHY